MWPAKSKDIKMEKSHFGVLLLFSLLIYTLYVSLHESGYETTEKKITKGINFSETEFVKNNTIPAKAVLMSRIKGYGLGNHLFSYAISYTLSRNLKLPLLIPIPSDTIVEDTKNFTNRDFIMDQLLLPKGSHVEFKEIPNQENIYTASCEMAKDPSLIPEEIMNTTKYFKVNFFCSDTSFKDYEEELQEIKVKLENKTDSYTKWNKLISNTEWPVAVHVRRGDIEDQYWSAPVEYFQEALRRMKQELPHGLAKRVLVFSDDIGWAKENLVGEGFFLAELGWPIYFVSGSFGGLTNLEELDLMIKCKSIIVSCSTFSWWAAYIMKNTGSRKKIIIRPKFNATKHRDDPVGSNGKPRHDYGISYPKEWIYIDT